MSKKKFVNVDYEGVATDVDITSSNRLGELQDAVKAKYGDALPVGAALIKFYDQQDQQITKWAQFNSLHSKYFVEDGLCLVIKTSSPTLNHSTQVQQLQTTMFEDYADFTESDALSGYKLIEFVNAGKMPEPSFMVVQEEVVNHLKNWVSNAVLADNARRSIVAINGFTKTGKSTLAACVLPSLIKKSLAAKPVGFKIAFVYLELGIHKGNALSIASSFSIQLVHEATRIGMTVNLLDCKTLGDFIVRIQALMKDFHAFAVSKNIRVLFVFDEVQRFFQAEDCNYLSMAELFKFITVSNASCVWKNFLFVLTGSGMAMAWRGFKSSSVQGTPLYTQVANINIASNNSIDVRDFVYEQFYLKYGERITPNMMRNPACISFYCLSFIGSNLIGRGSATAEQCTYNVEVKLILEICEDLVPLLQTFNENELKTILLLATNVCPTDPQHFFTTTKSYFDRFLKVYDNPDAEQRDRFESLFPNEPCPDKLYGIGYDSTYTPVIQMLVSVDGKINAELLSSLQSISLPFSLQAANIMNILIHCGERIYSLLKRFLSSNTIDPAFAVVDQAVQQYFGHSLSSDHTIYQSFIDDSNNSGFKKKVNNMNNALTTPSVPYGCFLLVAFRNCAIHSGLVAAYEKFPQKDTQIIGIARAVKDSGAFADIMCFLT